MNAAPSPDQRRWWVIGGALIALAMAGIIYYGVNTTGQRITPTITAFTVTSPTSIDVEYAVAAPADTPLLCRITALDKRKLAVGTIDDTIPATAETSSHRAVTVRTTVEAVSAVVDSCERL